MHLQGLDVCGERCDAVFQSGDRPESRHCAYGGFRVFRFCKVSEKVTCSGLSILRRNSVGSVAIRLPEAKRSCVFPSQALARLGSMHSMTLPGNPACAPEP